MSFFVTKIEHAFAIAAGDLVKAGKFAVNVALPFLKKVAAEEKTVESLTQLVDPHVVGVERAAFAVLGKVIAAIEDGAVAVLAGGLNINLDATELADLRAIKAALTPAALAQMAGAPGK